MHDIKRHLLFNINSTRAESRLARIVTCLQVFRGIGVQYKELHHIGPVRNLCRSCKPVRMKETFIFPVAQRTLLERSHASSAFERQYQITCEWKTRPTVSHAVRRAPPPALTRQVNACWALMQDLAV